MRYSGDYVVTDGLWLAVTGIVLTKDRASLISDRFADWAERATAALKALGGKLTITISSSVPGKVVFQIANCCR